VYYMKKNDFNLLALVAIVAIVAVISLVLMTQIAPAEESVLIVDDAGNLVGEAVLRGSMSASLTGEEEGTGCTTLSCGLFDWGSSTCCVYSSGHACTSCSYI